MLQAHASLYRRLSLSGTRSTLQLQAFGEATPARLHGFHRRTPASRTLLRPGALASSPPPEVGATGSKPFDTDIGGDMQPAKRPKYPVAGGKDSQQLAQELLKFINEAWTPFHAVGKPCSRCGAGTVGPLRDWASRRSHLYCTGRSLQLNGDHRSARML